MRHRHRPWMTAAAASLLLAGAGPAGELPGVRATLETDLAGLSGLGLAPDGTLWASPERSRKLLPLRVEQDRLVVAGPAVPLRGVPAGSDTEALAWLPDGTAALGTETRSPRDADTILLARREEDGFRVVDRIELPYAFWKLTPEPNRGIEGLCFAEGKLVAGLEIARTQDGHRSAPLALYDLDQKAWTFLWLRLTSERGKLSALTCRAAGEGGGIEVRAIERHFGVSRLLGFELGEDLSDGHEIEPEIRGDLFLPGDGEPNYEALAWLPDGRLAVVADNHYGRVTGPASTRVLPAPDPR